MEYQVLVDEGSGDHFIEVPCGGVVHYAVRVRLTADEVRRFEADPKALDDLAGRIAANPEVFSDRMITN